VTTETLSITNEGVFLNLEAIAVTFPPNEANDNCSELATDVMDKQGPNMVGYQPRNSCSISHIYPSDQKITVQKDTAG
jgi:hypothetical protein